MKLSGWNQVLVHSLLGLFGSIVSGALVLFVLDPLMKGTESGLLVTSWLEGLCFISMGFCLGWSASNYLKLPKSRMRTLCGFYAVGGFFYGAFSFFSIGGAIIGFMLLAASAGAAMYVVSCSGQQAVAASSSIGIVLVLLFLLPRMFEQASIPVMSLLDPVRALDVIGVSGIVYIGAGGYVMNVLPLALLFLVARPATHGKELPASHV